MQRCLELATKGLGQVAPNPMVGCVIVCNGEVVAEGYHQQYGQAHAEPNAIKQVSDDILQQSTLYVTLEPCCHYGKTPPCADLIISKRIPRVIVGNLDSNPLVAGKGIQKLKEAGVEVEYGVLDKECKELNKRFFTFHEKKRPYVILKWAQTNDGFISKLPLPSNQKDNWITSTESKHLVHTWRSQEQAILIGYKTALADNPLLSTRLVSGANPIRLVIDEKLQLPDTLNVFNDESKTIVFNTLRDDEKNNIVYVKINFKNSTNDILNYCFTKNIASIIVEGGTKTIHQFIETNHWDEARVFVNPHLNFKTGVSAPELSLVNKVAISVGSDLLFTFKNV